MLDPSLSVIGRHVRTSFGGAVDPESMAENGNLVVVELKSGMTPRDVASPDLGELMMGQGTGVRRGRRHCRVSVNASTNRIVRYLAEMETPNNAAKVSARMPTAGNSWGKSIRQGLGRSNPGLATHQPRLGYRIANVFRILPAREASERYIGCRGMGSRASVSPWRSLRRCGTSAILRKAERRL